MNTFQSFQRTIWREGRLIKIQFSHLIISKPPSQFHIGLVKFHFSLFLFHLGLVEFHFRRIVCLLDVLLLLSGPRELFRRETANLTTEATKGTGGAFSQQKSDSTLSGRSYLMIFLPSQRKKSCDHRWVWKWCTYSYKNICLLFLCLVFYTTFFLWIRSLWFVFLYLLTLMPRCLNCRALATVVFK